MRPPFSSYCMLHVSFSNWILWFIFIWFFFVIQLHLHFCCWIQTCFIRIGMRELNVYLFVNISTLKLRYFTREITIFFTRSLKVIHSLSISALLLELKCSWIFSLHFTSFARLQALAAYRKLFGLVRSYFLSRDRKGN